MRLGRVKRMVRVWVEEGLYVAVEGIHLEDMRIIFERQFTTEQPGESFQLSLGAIELSIELRRPWQSL